MHLQMLKGESKVEQDDKIVEKSKAAAWAWYQHSNGGGGGLNPRCGTVSGARASRFKAEALKNGSYGRVDPRWDCDSSLFDSVELEHVSKQIDKAFNCSTVESHIAAVGRLDLYLPSSPPPPRKLTKASSLRMVFPKNFCRSISDVASSKEESQGNLGVRKGDCACYKQRNRRQNSWTFRKLSNAINVFMHLPPCIGLDRVHNFES